ncbi:cache domain-containing protein [Angustibacter luteus]|uniref:Cache domain-containing protein n=1 Tax=Angustibacter luteus TaxID=658456 RepID=A0ABW1JFP9_9ACTN
MTGPSRVATPLVAVDVVAAVDTVGGQVHGLLDGLRSQVASRFDGRRRPTQSELGIDDLAAAMLRLPDLPLAGAGFVAAQDALADVPYWLQWWTTDPDAAQPVVQRLQVQTDPAAEDFRDYTGLAWFTGPRDTGEPCLTGPYVDYLCTDEYTLTFTQPVETAVGLVGVVGADLYVRALEARVLPALARLDSPAALVNATGRVVTASGTGWVTGDLVRDVPVSRWMREGTDGDDAWELHRCTTVPLAVLQATPPLTCDPDPADVPLSGAIRGP